MKITVIGAGGVRTPMLLGAMIARRERLDLREIALMDVDGERLALIGRLAATLEEGQRGKLLVTRTTDPAAALTGADFVITTFRVGGMQARVVDERVPLSHGVLGQETTGPGGFAMALRSIPVLLAYVKLMSAVCPDAWLINFANPSGLLAEAVQRTTGWRRAVGICDAPYLMANVAAAVLGAAPNDVSIGYFGLNHLGWLRSIVYAGQDYAPALIARLGEMGPIPGLPFAPELIRSLGMFPNEYLYYYYCNAQAVQNILQAGQTRGERILAENERLFAELKRCNERGDGTGMLAAYQAYLDRRNQSYMKNETAESHSSAAPNPAVAAALAGEGYAGVALGVIEGLCGASSKRMVLNVVNNGAIAAMDSEDVVEIPAFVSKGHIQPFTVGAIPDHCLGLMKQVKAYERLTIEAALEGSYAKALAALTLHPLVRDYVTAEAILDEYRKQHGELIPRLA